MDPETDVTADDLGMDTTAAPLAEKLVDGSDVSGPESDSPEEDTEPSDPSSENMSDPSAEELATEPEGSEGVPAATPETEADHFARLMEAFEESLDSMAIQLRDLTRHPHMMAACPPGEDRDAVHEHLRIANRRAANAAKRCGEVVKAMGR